MYKDFLSEVSIFSDLSITELEKVEKIVKLRDYPKGSMVILEEEYGDIILFIT